MELITNLTKFKVEEIDKLSLDPTWIKEIKSSVVKVLLSHSSERITTNFHLLSSQDLKAQSELMNNKRVNSIASYRQTFSTEKSNLIDWTVDFPEPSFHQWKFADKLIELGVGYWIPRINGSLEDVGLVLFQTSTLERILFGG